MGELRLSPEGYLGEGGGKVGTIHKVEVVRRFVDYAVNGYDLIVDSLSPTISISPCTPVMLEAYLELLDRRSLQTVQSDQDC